MTVACVVMGVRPVRFGGVTLVSGGEGGRGRGRSIARRTSYPACRNAVSPWAHQSIDRHFVLQGNKMVV